MNTLIAIDPGASGAISAWDGERAEVYKMPDTPADIAALLGRLWLEYQQPDAVVERVGSYMPGNSGPAACKFARHCGHVEMALICHGIPHKAIAPSVWMKSLGALPKAKGDRKRAIKDMMQRRYPYLDVTLWNADALGILTWALDGRK